MSTLHIINKQLPAQGLSACLRVLRPGDAILLIEDGVYLCATKPIAALPDTVHCHVLQEDLQARGLALPVAADNCQMVNYTGFVTLVCSHSRSLGWC